MKTHYDIFLTGKVQGVGLRFYTMQAAYRYNIMGTIEIKGKDKVLIEAEGTEQNLAVFVEWCHMGSPFSKIKEIQIEEGPLKDYNSFDIIRKHKH
jgi:acylphosphatase